MKRVFLMLVVLVLIPVICFAARKTRLDGSIASDQGDAVVQTFIPDPALSQVKSEMTGTLVFKKGTGADVNITGWFMMIVVPTAESTYYFNSDTTKTFPLFANTINEIIFGQMATGESVTLVLGSATASIQGMRKY